MKPIEELTIAEGIKERQTLIDRLSELDNVFNRPSKIEGAPPQAGARLLVGERVIVRCRNAGVHFGTLVEVQGQTATLTSARRLWRYWSGGGEHTLSGVARHGLADRQEVKIAGPVDTIILPEACEIMSMSAEAASNVENYRVAQAD